MHNYTNDIISQKILKVQNFILNMFKKPVWIKTYFASIFISVYSKMKMNIKETVEALATLPGDTTFLSSLATRLVGRTA